MITQIRLIRNVGQLDCVGASPQTQLGKLTLIYGENGRGKTTLSAIWRSLASGDPIPITERSRLGTNQAPHVVMQFDSSQPPCVFENGHWNQAHAEIIVFDDIFVDENVYSGLEVSAIHRHNLHELILGSDGVTFARQVDELSSQIGKLNSELRFKQNGIPTASRGPFNVDDFCNLTKHPDIEGAIQATERLLGALGKSDQVKKTPIFDALTFPHIDIPRLQSVLTRTIQELSSEALTRVRQHISRLGDKSEQWLSDGTKLVQSDDQRCPFCDQSMKTSTIAKHYEAYFSEAYARLKKEINSELETLSKALSGDSLATFLRDVQTANERQVFWSQFCSVPALSIDLDGIAKTWQTARGTVVSALETKNAAPLECITLAQENIQQVENLNRTCKEVQRLSDALISAKENIEQVKKKTSTSDSLSAKTELRRLQAIRERFSETTSPLCDEYLKIREAKRELESNKQEARRHLDSHRNTVFPKYQSAINNYLQKFNAGFAIQGVQASNAGGRPSSAYYIAINNTPVRLASGLGSPSFRNTLSAGDRNSLALAFFFASLAHDTGLSDRLIVIDDAVSSLDEHRKLATIQIVRRLAQQTAQMIVLSHDKSFLCQIYQYADKDETITLQVDRSSSGSVVAEWDITEDAITEYDRRHAMLRAYQDSNTGSEREVAHSIRMVLEGFIRVAFTEHFPAGQQLRTFRDKVAQHLNQPAEIMEATNYQEMCDLIEYGNRFHHDTNPAWQTETINGTELLGFVTRTLQFVKQK